MAHDVFISYSSKDKPIADAVCARLEAAGVRAWIAPRDIGPGEDWPTAITNAIALSRVMVLVFSAHSNSSADVGRELNLATNERLVIIPFKIENIEPEPGKLYYLAGTHWLDAMNPPTEEQIGQLVQRVVSILQVTGPKAPPAPVPVRSPRGPRPARKPRWGLLLLLGLILALVAVGILAEGALFGPPAAGQPTATSRPTASASPQVQVDYRFADNFQYVAFAGYYNTVLWSASQDTAHFSFKQGDGFMSIAKDANGGGESGTLTSNTTWSLDQVTPLEASLRLDSQHTGSNGNVALTIGTSDWWAGCGIGLQAAPSGPNIWCGQSALTTGGNFAYMKGDLQANYDTWYTVRLVYDPATNILHCSIDDQPYASWQLQSQQDLSTQPIRINIGIWVDPASMLTGDIGPVHLGP